MYIVTSVYIYADWLLIALVWVYLESSIPERAKLDSAWYFYLNIN